jgi:hypothetical protein
LLGMACVLLGVVSGGRQRQEELSIKIHVAWPEGLCMVTRQYDFVCISEAPNDEVVAKVTLATSSKGSITTETLRAFTEDEYGRSSRLCPEQHELLASRCAAHANKLIPKRAAAVGTALSVGFFL